MNYQIKNIHIHIFKDINEISKKAFHLFKNIHKNSSSRIYIVPGGSTPLFFYKNLASGIVDWRNTTFILSDERIVSKQSKLSNLYHINSNFINQIQSNSISFFSFNEFYNNRDSFQNIKLQLSKKLNQLSKPDIAILGLGEDGHTASIFPGTTNIDNKKNSLIVIKNNHETFSRVSLTFSYLMKARRLLFLICGKSKAEAFSECVYGNKIHEHFPSNYIFNNYKKRIDIYCDKAAASKLYK